MKTADLLEQYEDGNDIGWSAEFAWLWENHSEQMVDLITSIRQNGIQVPVMLGPDGSIWDGHHRIAAAVALGLADIPAVLADVHPAVAEQENNNA